MNKKQLLRYIDGSATSAEKEEVLKWASLNKENEEYLIRLMNLWVSQNLPEERADKSKYAQFEQYLAKQNHASETKRTKRINIFAWSAAAALILLLIGWNLSLQNFKSKKENVITAIIPPANVSTFRTLYTEKGVKAKLILPDSSIVWLNSDTEIKYPDTFGDKTREITLSGEAFFEVVKDASRPMTITTGKGFQVRVTGTTFNLKAYNDDNLAKTTLYSGSVTVLYKGKDNKIMEEKIEPNHSLTISDNNTCSKTKESDIETISLWKEGKIHFDSTPIREAIKILERWHGTQFIVPNSEVLDYKISANFESESIVQIMELIKLTTFIDYSIQGNKVTIIKR